MASQQQDPALTAKIQALADLIREQSRAHIAARYSAEQASWCDVQVIPGKVYTKIDRGDHPGEGFLMVEHATGYIFGIKGYGKVHKGLFCGTLDRTGDYYWGDTVHGPDRLPRR